MVEKQIEETKRKELVHIKHIWVFICPIFVQLLYNFLLTCSLGLCDVYSRYYSDGINYILVSNEKSTKFVLGVPNLKFYKSNWQLPFYVVRYFICFLSNKAVALSLLLEQRQGLLLIHSKRTGGAGESYFLMQSWFMSHPHYSSSCSCAFIGPATMNKWPSAVLCCHHSGKPPRLAPYRYNIYRSTL